VNELTDLVVDVADHAVIGVARGADLFLGDIVFVHARQVIVALAVRVTLVDRNRRHGR
jgi:hypothetical protein